MFQTLQEHLSIFYPIFPVSFIQTLITLPHLFPQGFSFWPGKSVKEHDFTDSSFRFCSPTKSRMQHNLSQNLVLTSMCPIFIVKWFRYNQWTCAESHLTFSMIFFPSSCYQFYILILLCLVCIVNHRPALVVWKLLGFLKECHQNFSHPRMPEYLCAHKPVSEHKTFCTACNTSYKVNFRNIRFVHRNQGFSSIQPQNTMEKQFLDLKA